MLIPVIPVRRVQVTVVDVVDVVAVLDLRVTALRVVRVGVPSADHVRLRRRYADLRLLVRRAARNRRGRRRTSVPVVAATTNPASASTTMVAPGATFALYDVTMPARHATTPITQAVTNVLRNDRVICCAVATGTTISALTSSSPTVRIATVTVTAAITAISRFSSWTRSPVTRANSSSWHTANNCGPQPDRHHQYGHSQPDDDVQVTRRHSGQ